MGTQSSRFFALEGIDGSGKTFTAKMLRALAELFGRKMVITQEPSEGPTGVLIRDKLEGRSPMVDPFELQRLFVKDRFEHVQSVILPILADKRTIVVCDRYWLSTISYGMLSHPLETWTHLHEEEFGHSFLRPAHSFIFDLPVDTALERIHKGRGEKRDYFEKRSKLEKVRENYLRIQKALPDISIIDATLGPGSRAQACWDVIAKKLNIS